MSHSPYTILCVDDEENILSAMRRVLRKEDYRILIAASGVEGLKLLQENEVHLVISDQRMPEMSGTEFLATVRKQYPEVVRIILSGYTDVDAITESINEGHIYKFLLKPWDDQVLKLEIKKALDYHDLIHANALLQRTILEQNEKLININETLENLVRKRTEELEIQNQVLELSRAILEFIPMPVIGVSEEGIIVFLNRQADKLLSDNRPIAAGKEFSDYFRSDLVDNLNAGLKDQRPSVHRCYPFDGRVYDVDITPLSGKFKGKGVIVSLKVHESVC